MLRYTIPWWGALEGRLVGAPSVGERGGQGFGQVGREVGVAQQVAVIGVPANA